jgi:broad specificity phosphatase PhoE
MQILLARHGETDSNAARVVQLPDAPLSTRGVAQATRLAERLATLGVAAIVSSDYARARMTAERVQAATGAPLEILPGLRERNLGDLRGRAYSEFDFDIFAPDYAPPRGETWPAFHGRVDRAWERVQTLAAATDGHLAVVTQGLVCRSVASRHLCLPAGEVVPERWENTSVTVVERAAPWRVSLLNCVAHLDEVAAPPDASGVA